MKNKVLIIGIDAMDSRIVDELGLPNLKSLETYTKLQTTIPPETPVAWSAASTGTNPGKYGIFDFINRDLQTYTPRLNLAIEKRGIVKTEFFSLMKGTPFWRILSENNIPSTIIRWPVTFPPEKINGKILSGLGTVDIKGMLNKYSFYTNDNFNGDEESTGNIIPIEIQNNVIETYISGPLINKGGELKDVKKLISIILKEDKLIIKIDNKDYEIGLKRWSEMIKTKFKVYFMSVYGIFKIYLESIKPTFKMYMTSVQIDPENQIYDITYPKDYGKELEDNIGSFHTLGMPEDTKAVTENKISESVFIEQVKQIEEERKKMFIYEFKRFNEGTLACVFDAGDRLKHIFWNNRLDDDRDVIKNLPKEIKDYYVEKDKFIGNVISQLDKNTKLIIFSDHGFSTFKRQVNINSWLVKEGFMKSDGKGILFESVDWNNTQAYSLGFTSIYLNLKGRERKGIVNCGEKNDIINKIIRKLKNIKDGNKTVLTNIYKGSEIYRGKHTDLAPDIVLGFSPGYRMSWKSASGSIEDEIIYDNAEKWRGDHLIDRTHVPGVLFTNFKIKKDNPTILDIAPTVLKLLDVKIPDYIDGEALI
tara:strand:+ start:220 stop:1989 length:1770 start_codon:yes stop_codon:yes gene_type:complete